jgi:hypothetical protein
MGGIKSNGTYQVKWGVRKTGLQHDFDAVQWPVYKRASGSRVNRVNSRFERQLLLAKNTAEHMEPRSTSYVYVQPSYAYVQPLYAYIDSHPHPHSRMQYPFCVDY